MGLGRYAVILMIGAPGAGKGTQARNVCEMLGIPHIATGDLLREHRRRGTLLGRMARAFMDRGDLVPDDLAVHMVVERLGRPDAANGVLLDGFPRTLVQARALDAELDARGGGVRAVLSLDVPTAALIRRLAGRRVCIGCQSTFHVNTLPSPTDTTCPDCGDTLVRRPDDAPDVVEHRVAVYLQETAPVVDHYRERDLVQHVDGNRPVTEIRADLGRAIQHSRPALAARSCPTLANAGGQRDCTCARPLLARLE